MAGTEANRNLRLNAAADLWRNTLSQIPCLFGRLVYLAGLRNPNTGQYEHHGFAARFGDEEAHRVLRDSHRETFEAWLSLPLKEQRADLQVYLHSLETDRRTVIEAWLRLRSYHAIFPADAHDAEIQLHVANLDALLELLRNEYGVAWPDRDA